MIYKHIQGHSHQQQWDETKLHLSVILLTLEVIWTLLSKCILSFSSVYIYGNNYYGVGDGPAGNNLFPNLDFQFLLRPHPKPKGIVKVLSLTMMLWTSTSGLKIKEVRFSVCYTN